MATIFPEFQGHPYYIVAPEYLTRSAGIRALHLLGHALNKTGRNAFMSSPRLNPDFLTKPLTLDVIQHHYENKITPIVIYPETIKGNPYHAPFVVRYIMNFPGLLGGDKSYPPSELCFGYSKELVENQKEADRENVLYIPGCDTSIFHPPKDNKKRAGSCFFAAKYKIVHRGKTFEITSNSAEITRGLPDSPSPKQIADLLRSSEYFYAYENTSLATEATLCGCPAIFLPNRHLTKRIATNESGSHGIAWGTDPAEIARAKATVHLAYQDYLKQIDLFWHQLDKFVEITQRAVSTTPYSNRVKKVRLAHDSLCSGVTEYERAKPTTSRDKLYAALEVSLTLTKEVGIAGFARKVVKGLREGGTDTIKKRALGVFYRM